jgi:hypothetical protein
MGGDAHLGVRDLEAGRQAVGGECQVRRLRWAHVRRRLAEAKQSEPKVVAEAVALMGQLSAIERRARNVELPVWATPRAQEPHRLLGGCVTACSRESRGWS